MSANANFRELMAQIKCGFAKLKYEQMLSDKYFIETCFSRIDQSYSSKNKLIDMLFKIKCYNEKN